MTDRHRRCVVLRGTEEETERQALECIEGLDEDHVLWVSDAGVHDRTHTPFVEVKRKLGVSYDVVVLDLHHGLNADVIGQCHGFIWGGGALILRMLPLGQAPKNSRARFVVHPYTPDDVGDRFYRRFEASLARHHLDAPQRLRPAHRLVTGSAEQREVVEHLTRLFVVESPSVAVLISDRGRGKSSALGLALRAALTTRTLRIAVTAANEASTAEVFRFAIPTEAEDHSSLIEYVRPEILAYTSTKYDVIIVDEAAQLSVQLLQCITLGHPDSRLALATTAQGYEGTGRGFVLRFIEWLKNQPRPVMSLNLNEPIRWDAQDPLEALVYDALLLDASIAPYVDSFELSEISHSVIDRDSLFENERLLRDFFGLLVHAHYRTTPSDLHRILDAPNLRLHALTLNDRVVAATMVALEGSLPQSTSDAVYWGRARVRGNALAETLISHSGHQEAGALSMVRSIRIAVHPDMRRRGLATLLVKQIHESYQPDLFGTLFGVTEGLLRFRRSLGYEVIRVGASRGSRTGEPAVVMIRPVSQRARDLYDALRAELARDLPTQLDLQRADGDVPLSPELEHALMRALPPPATLTDEYCSRAVAAFAFGPRTVEAVALPLARFIEQHQDTLMTLPDRERGLILGRIIDKRSWAEVMNSTGMPSLPATMRATRRAVRELVVRAAPHLENQTAGSDL